MTGSWVTEEVYKALELGYKIVKIFEVWHYEEMAMYDPTTKTGGLFVEYINTFLRLKQQADGWPSWVKTEEDQTKYVQNYYDHEGIHLEKDRIKKNPSLRALAKLMLNSFWGKFGQRNNMVKTVYFTEPEPFCELVFDPIKIIHGINYVNDNMVAVSYSIDDEYAEVMGNTNPVIAAYTTTHARLKLYSYIEKLQDRVMYFDTDSIIYLSSKPGVYEPELESYHGYMSNELKDPNSYICEFLGCGPKNYAYKVCTIKHDMLEYTYSVKVCGFVLTTIVMKQLNFDNMRRMLFAFVKHGCKEEFVLVTVPRIERVAVTHQIVTKIVPKKYRVVYDKRVVLDNFCTVPFGY